MPSPDPACSSAPSDYSEDALKAYASHCGTDAAAQEIYNQTGYDVRQDYDENGNISWKKVALHLASTGLKDATGVDVNLNNLVNPDGSINGKNAVADAGAVGGGAICIVGGAGAFTKVCSAVGGAIGGAIYGLASSVGGLFHDDPTQGPMTPNPNEDIAAVEDWYATYRKSRAADAYAQRAIALLIASTTDKLRAQWARETGQAISWRGMYDKLLAAGLKPPRDWASQLGSAGNVSDMIRPDESAKGNTRAAPAPGTDNGHAEAIFTRTVNGQDLVTTPEWVIGYGLFGHGGFLSPYDRDSFLAQLGPGLRTARLAFAEFGIDKVTDSTGAVVMGPKVSWATDLRDPPSPPNQNEVLAFVHVTFSLAQTVFFSDDPLVAKAQQDVAIVQRKEFLASLDTSVARVGHDLHVLRAHSPPDLRAASLGGPAAAHAPHAPGSALGTVVKVGLLGALGYAGYHAYTHGLWPFHGHAPASKKAPVKKKRNRR